MWLEEVHRKGKEVNKFSQPKSCNEKWNHTEKQNHWMERRSKKTILALGRAERGLSWLLRNTEWLQGPVLQTESCEFQSQAAYPRMGWIIYANMQLWTHLNSSLSFHISVIEKSRSWQSMTPGVMVISSLSARCLHTRKNTVKVASFAVRKRKQLCEMQSFHKHDASAPSLP